MTGEDRERAIRWYVRRITTEGVAEHREKSKPESLGEPNDLIMGRHLLNAYELTNALVKRVEEWIKAEKHKTAMAINVREARQ